MLKEKKDIVYPIKINPELWEKFKDKIPRAKTINEALIEIIEKEVHEK
jgi:hypothetical protein